MATKKQLVEAQSFSRRRLLTAFVSGAPGGRELEPTSPVRGVVVGVVLAVLVVVGGLASGLLNRGLPNGWENGQILVVSDNAARYVTDDGRLVPVTNMASARLLVPPGASIHNVSDRLLEGVERLGRAGITGAPDSLPDASLLVDDAWRACLAPDGTSSVSVRALDDADAADPSDPSDAADPAGGTDAADAAPPVPDVTASTLVRVGDQRYLVQGATAFPVADIPGLPRALGFTAAAGFDAEVDRAAREEWLALFGRGDGVAPFVVDGAGGVPAGSLGTDPAIRVGTVVVPGGGVEQYLVLADGTLAPLSEFAGTVYALGEGATQGVVDVPAAQLADVAVVAPESNPVPATWPSVVASPLPPTRGACAQLDAAAFGSTLQDGALPPTGGVVVAPGTGALALFAAEAGSTAGPVRFIDENGLAYAVEGGAVGTREEAVERLFPVAADDEAAVPTSIPYAWGDLFESGPTLSIDNAQASRTQVPTEEAPGEATAEATP